MVDMGCGSGRHLGTLPGGLRGAERSARTQGSRSPCRVNADRHRHGRCPARHPNATRLHTHDGQTFQYAASDVACDRHTQAYRFDGTYPHADADRFAYTRTNANADADKLAHTEANANADANTDANTLLATNAHPYVHAKTDAPANSRAQGDANANRLRRPRPTGAVDDRAGAAVHVHDPRG